MRVPFFGLLSTRSPLEGLVEHYEKVNECVELIKDALSCYVMEGTCIGLEELARDVDELEDQADKIKRRIRNRLPRRLFMPVDKLLFFNYTRAQDDILDTAQDCMYWLAMRYVKIPEEFRKDLIEFLDDVFETLTLLGPALKATVGFIYAKEVDRRSVKDKLRKARYNHEKVFKKKNKIIARIYNSEMDFKDIHQLLHFVDLLAVMSHHSRFCAEILRAMIAK